MAMQPDLTLFSIILLVGAAHGLFLTMTVINIKDSQGSGRLFLALLTFACVVDLAHEFLFQTEYLLDALQLAYLDPVVNLLYGPSLYLYVRSLTEGSLYKFRRWQWLHLLPFGCAALLCFILPNLSVEQFYELYYEDAAAVSSAQQLVGTFIGGIALVSVISIGSYLALCFRLLFLHAKNIRQQFSDIESITFNWLRNLLIAFSVIYALLIVDGFFTGLLGSHEDLNNLLYVMVVAMIYAMGYMGMKQPDIFTSRESLRILKSNQNDTDDLEALDNGDSDEQSKYKTSSLDSSMSSLLKDELEKHMLNERPYLE
ncbi:MAG: hypothetical protein HKP09_08305, partial [Enterobacterales bacterium]|nr:hypothetical protein [Enterobacterales bacterium]